MANALKWMWALQDKAMNVMGISSGQQEKAKPLPTAQTQSRDARVRGVV